MKHIQVAPHEKSGIKDKNNCTICALSTAACIPYHEAFEIGKESGRKTGKGFATFKLMDTAKKFGIRFEKIESKTISIKNFLLKFPRGRFIVRRRGHAFAIIDGAIYDHITNKPLQRITDIWKVENHRLERIKAM
jgi:hypothetical protein